MSAIDEHVGLRLLQLRSDHDLGTWELAAILCTSIEDVELIEDGHRRLRAVELLALSNRFKVPISYFFEDLDIGRLTIDPLGKFIDERNRTKTR